MKNDMSVFYDADPDLQKLKAQIEYTREVIEFIRRCMQECNTQDIKQLKTLLNAKSSPSL